MTELRPLREEDADAVAQLFVEAWGDSRRMDGDEIREWLANESLQHENLLVLEQEGRVAGYFDVWPEGETADIDIAAPGRWEEAYDHAERRAAELGAARARSFVAEGHDVEHVLAGRGYRKIRASWTMEIELGDAPPEAVVPPGLELRPYRHPDDERAVHEATQEAFADHFGFHPQPIETFRAFNIDARNFEPGLWLVAWDGAEVAGAALNFFDRPADPGYGWVGTLGVRRRWRRRGLGEALLLRSFALLHERGQRRARLSVDAESPTGATRLYERAGMSVLRRSNTWERTLGEAGSKAPGR